MTYRDTCPPRTVTVVHHTVQTWLPVTLSCGHVERINWTARVGSVIGCTECARHAEALEQITDEDLAIFFHHLGETARLATRAECVEFGERTPDARLMKRLTQWRGSSLQQGSPIAKQLAGWDFSTATFAERIDPA